MNSTANAENVVIIGGGPVGSVLALSLQQQGLPFTLLEAREKGAAHQDKRALALSYGTRLVLEKLNVWDAVEAKATAIDTIHISQRGGFGRTKLTASEHNLPAIGYVVSYGALTQALDAVLDTTTVLYGAEATDIQTSTTQQHRDVYASCINAHFKRCIVGSGGWWTQFKCDRRY